ncbi:MAG: DUF1697 domain-containing protein [Pseudolabrys sp.]
MTTFIALLRAINVGGTGKLPMAELAALCTGLGLENVRTYIQSGNVVFESGRSEEALQSALARALAAKMGRDVDLALRSAAEMRAVLKGNPFPDAPGAKVGVAFGMAAIPEQAVRGLVIPGREEVRVGKRDIYIHFPDGVGRSKLKLPAALGPLTVRNINTVTKLVAMSGA